MNRSLIIMFLTFVSTFTLFAQNEDGVRNIERIPDNPPFSAFHTAVPIIRSIPPLSLSMPYDVLLGYIAMDSIARFYNDSAYRAVRGQSLERDLDNLQPSNDTLHTIWRLWYQMQDYDPIRFYQYLIEQYISQNNNYAFRFYNVQTLSYKTHKLNHPLKKRIASALIPDFILKVQVVGIDSMKSPVSGYGDTSKFIFYDIKCIVLDTLKGKVIPMESISNNLSQKKTEQPNSINGYFHFVVSNNSYPQVRYSPHSNTYFPKIDSLIFDNSTKFMRVHNGQELLVFLSLVDELHTKTHDYIHIHTATPASNGVLPIVNGMVSDVNKIWSDNTWISYESWKEKYNDAVNIIMTKDY